jgi:chromosome segregation ATPase
MGTNGTDGAAHLMVEEQSFGIERINGCQDQVETGHDFAFEPLVNRIAFGIARELASAVKQVEHHIGGEARKLAEAVEHRLDSFQIANSAVHDHLQQLATADAGLWEATNRQAAELETLRTEARDFSTAVFGRFDETVAALQGEMNVSLQPVWERIDNLSRNLDARQEDIAATKSTLDAISSRADAFVERLDRQADAVRSLHTSSSHRDAELEQIVDLLARLRANPTPALASEL